MPVGAMSCRSAFGNGGGVTQCARLTIWRKTFSKLGDGLEACRIILLHSLPGGAVIVLQPRSWGPVMAPVEHLLIEI